MRTGITLTTMQGCRSAYMDRFCHDSGDYIICFLFIS